AHGHILKTHRTREHSRPAAKVAVQPGHRALESAGPAEVLPAHLAVTLLAMLVLDVIDDHQVEPAVPVVIHKGRRRAPERVVQPPLPGDVGEGAILVIEDQPDAAVLGDEHVGPAIIVDVADGYPQAGAFEVQARALADVGEAAVLLLAEEPVGGPTS